ncbi:MAG: hypothetical protein HQK88_10250 [Nitrospirae bacterium]|nr:hypothetical protein [Nitrospirota bacterium]MBF0617179.1 hypothetical protein [Nitrospirota bacterium]
MPVLGITDDEADTLIAFLEWTSKVDTNVWPPKPVPGLKVSGGGTGDVAYEKNNCSSCHIIN